MIQTSFCKVVVKERSISLPSNISLYGTESIKLSATVDPQLNSTDKIVWKSSNVKIAKVDQKGVVTGVKPSNSIVTISATVYGKTAECKVRVLQPTLNINATSKTLYAIDGYNTFQLNATTKPQTVVTWSSSKSAVATVDNNGKVTAKTKGTTTIYAKANGITKKCVITVKNPEIKMGKSTMSIYVGDTGTIVATTNPADQTITWSSSDASIATVKNGIVTGKKAGKVKIYATVGATTKSCSVTVKNPGLKLNTSSFKIYVDETREIKATTTPIGRTVTWSSSDTSIATVDKGVVTGKKAGKVKIYATVGATTRTCTVTIKNPVLKLNTSGFKLFAGQTKEIKATTTPTGRAVTWKSSDTSIATVKNGIVTGKKAGKVKVSATVGATTKSCTVTVKNPVLNLSTSSFKIYEGQTKTIKASTTPKGQVVTWKSSDTSIATVKNGVVTGKMAGTVKISATVGATVKTCTVTVKETGLLLHNTKLNVYVGQTGKIKATTTPAGKTVTWKSSDTSIATVENGIVTGKKAGTVEISATAGTTTKTCVVTVKAPASKSIDTGVLIDLKE